MPPASPLSTYPAMAPSTPSTKRWSTSSRLSSSTTAALIPTSGSPTTISFHPTALPTRSPTSRRLLAQSTALRRTLAALAQDTTRLRRARDLWTTAARRFQRCGSTSQLRAGLKMDIVHLLRGLGAARVRRPLAPFTTMSVRTALSGRLRRRMEMAQLLDTRFSITILEMYPRVGQT